MVRHAERHRILLHVFKSKRPCAGFQEESSAPGKVRLLYLCGYFDAYHAADSNAFEDEVRARAIGATDVSVRF